MKRIIFAVAALLIFSGWAIAGGGLDGFLGDLNIQARADMNGFSAKISVQFGVPVAEVRTVIETVSEPADAFMCFQLGQWSNKPSDQVVKVYKTRKGKGWGVIAKSLGIKPGSAEFHALKRGDLTFNGAPAGGQGEGYDKHKGKGKGKGHKK